MSPRITDEQKELRRLQILVAAKKVFSKKGFSAVTLKDIVEETGMSRGWIYLYFQTKEEIFEALLDQQDLEYKRYIDDLLTCKPCIGDIVKHIYLEQQKELLTSTNCSLLPAFYEYFLTGCRVEARKGLLLERYERGITQFATLLQIGVDQGEFKPTLPVVSISRLAASFQEGIMTHTIAVGPQNANTQFQIEALVQYLFKLLKPVDR